MNDSVSASTDISYDGHDLEALFDLDRYQSWIVRSFAPYLGRHAVEFGAGIGAMSRRIRPIVERLDLVEPSVNLVPALQRRFADDEQVAIFQATLEAYLARCAAESRDSCVLVNLLEHIDEDGAALAAMRRILRPRGHLLLFVPAMPCLYSRLDSILGHHRRYTRRGLARTVTEAGFHLLDIRYFDILGVLPWWLVNTLGGKREFDPRLARLYDRVGVPLTRAVEALIRPPFGKNLLAIAERSD